MFNADVISNCLCASRIKSSDQTKGGCWAGGQPYSEAVKEVASAAHEGIVSSSIAGDGMTHVRRWWWGQGVQLLTVTAAGALLTGAALVISASYFPHFIVFGKGGGGGVTQSTTSTSKVYCFILLQPQPRY